MTLSSHPIADQVYQITLSGLLTWDEFQTYLAQVESKAFASGKVRACIKTNSLIYMTIEPASSRLLAD